MKIPFRNIATATALTIMRALSFQITEPHNQPKPPKNCRNIFQGYISLVVAIIANINTIDDIHFNHHENGC